MNARDTAAQDQTDAAFRDAARAAVENQERAGRGTILHWADPGIRHPLDDLVCDRLITGMADHSIPACPHAGPQVPLYWFPLGGAAVTCPVGCPDCIKRWMLANVDGTDADRTCDICGTIPAQVDGTDQAWRRQVIIGGDARDGRPGLVITIPYDVCYACDPDGTGGAR